jgi:hypothetical protein
MAGLLLAVVVGPLGSGCLLPQDDQVFPELPPRRNTPPRIVNWAPEARAVYFSSTGCPNQAFSVTVVDDDTSDTLRALWFINRTKDSQPYSSSPLFPSASATRTIPAPTGRFVTDLANLSVGFHQVTVFVTDGDFREVVDGNISADRPPRALPDGGLVDDVAFIDTFSWFLEVQQCP